MKNEMEKKLAEITGKTVIISADSTEKETIYKVCSVSYNDEKPLRSLIESIGLKTYGGNFSIYAY